MEIILSNASNKPIYEQIELQMRDAILSGELAPGEQLPSIRALAADLRVSVITTKRVYTDLEEQGYVVTVQGKGTFVTGSSQALLREQRLMQVEADLRRALDGAAAAGITLPELHEMLDTMAEL